MSETSQHWIRTRLGDTQSTILTGPFGTMLHKSDYVEDGIPLVNPMNIIGSEIVPSTKMMVSEATKRRLENYVLRKGDVVIARRGELGRCAVVTDAEDGWLCGTGSFFVRLPNSINAQYFVTFFRSNAVKEVLDQNSIGTTMSNLNHGILNDLEIPLPPLKEQLRIMKVLDEAFEAIAAAKANTKKNLQATRALFEAFRDSVFLSNEGGAHSPLREIAAFRNGVNFTRSSRGRTLAIVGVRDFRDRFLIPTEGLDSVTIDGEVNDDDILRSDDLLTVRSNGNAELIGRTMVAENYPPNVLHSGFTIRTRLLKKDVSPKYLCHFMRSRRTRRQMIDAGNGVNIKSLNQGTLGELTVPLPPHHKQIAIAEKLEQVNIETQLLEQRYRQKINALADLKSSLLHQAFSGNL